MTATRKKAGPKKPEPKPTAAAQPAAGKSKKEVVASVKTAATKPTTPVLVVPNQSTTTHSRKSLISSIAFPYKRVWS